MSDVETIRHNAVVTQSLIENHDKIFGMGGPGIHEMPPLDRRAKGQSRPALTPGAMKYIENKENRRAASVLTPFIEELKAVPRSYYLGYDLYTLVCLCGWNTTDHGYLRNLKAPEDDEGRRELEAWDFTTHLIATKATKKLIAEERNPRLNVVISPRDEPADSPIQAHNRENNRRRSWKAKDGYKRLYFRFMDWWKQNEDMSKPAAKEEFIKAEEKRATENHREAVSKRTLERALRHVEVEQ